MTSNTPMAPKKSLFASPSSLSHHLVETSVHLKISSPLIDDPWLSAESRHALCNKLVVIRAQAPVLLTSESDLAAPF